ncbi:MAG: hypothetical protein J5598_01840 [Clostridia bacterium]|nr:hypothetical protein [Clostridia bacterium]
MNILRRIVSAIVLVAAVVVLVGVCLHYHWGDFATAFKPFNFNEVVDALLAFFAEAGNAIVLTMLGFIGLTIPGRAK